MSAICTNELSKIATLALIRCMGGLDYGIAPAYVIAEANVSTHEYANIEITNFNLKRENKCRCLPRRFMGVGV